MEKIKELLSKTKCSVTIYVNPNKNYYESIEQYFNGQHEKPEIDPEVYHEMIMQDSLVEITVYPITPIGSFTIYHYDIEKAIELAIKNI